MPQFDTLTFFSQLIYVCFGFNFLFLIVSFYLLPALSSILKTRKRALESTETSLVTDSVTQGNTELFANTSVT